MSKRAMDPLMLMTTVADESWHSGWHSTVSSPAWRLRAIEAAVQSFTLGRAVVS